MKKDLTGTGVALVTPFHDNGRIDFKSLAQLLDHTAQGGADYWVLQGTTGEVATLSAAEKKDLLQFVVTHKPHQLPLVYGLGGNDTAALCETLQHVPAQDVAAILSVSPYYSKPSQAGTL